MVVYSAVLNTCGSTRIAYIAKSHHRNLPRSFILLEQLECFKARPTRHEFIKRYNIWFDSHNSFNKITISIRSSHNLVSSLFKLFFHVVGDDAIVCYNKEFYFLWDVNPSWG